MHLQSCLLSSSSWWGCSWEVKEYERYFTSCSSSLPRVSLLPFSFCLLTVALNYQVRESKLMQNKPLQHDQKNETVRDRGDGSLGKSTCSRRVTEFESPAPTLKRWVWLHVHLWLQHYVGQRKKDHWSLLHASLAPGSGSQHGSREHGQEWQSQILNVLCPPCAPGCTYSLIQRHLYHTHSHTERHT